MTSGVGEKCCGRKMLSGRKTSLRFRLIFSSRLRLRLGIIVLCTRWSQLADVSLLWCLMARSEMSRRVLSNWIRSELMSRMMMAVRHQLNHSPTPRMSYSSQLCWKPTSPRSRIETLCFPLVATEKLLIFAIESDYDNDDLAMRCLRRCFAHYSREHSDCLSLVCLSKCCCSMLIGLSCRKLTWRFDGPKVVRMQLNSWSLMISRAFTNCKSFKLSALTSISALHISKPNSFIVA